MKKNGTSKAGYVYILENTVIPDIIKIGEGLDAEERAKLLSRQTGAIGKYTVLWKHKVDEDNRAVEAALHYKLRQFLVDKEYFKIDKKRAISIASQLVKNIKPIKNPKAKQYQSLKNKPNKDKVKKASKSLWNDVIRSDSPAFIKEIVKLCLKEGRIGQPQYRRFSAVRSSKQTEIGGADLYILKEHLRIVIYCKTVHQAKRVIKIKIGNQVKIKDWEGGVSFFINGSKQYIALKKWFAFGKMFLTKK